MGIRLAFNAIFPPKRTAAGNAFVEFLPELESLAARVGQQIMWHFGAPAVVTDTKPDGSPVTDVDRAAEEMITMALSYLTPGMPVVGEEAYSLGDMPAPDISNGKFWLVDALDGTREFLKQSTDFTVNIALIENNIPVVGVIHHPAESVTYSAAGEGTAVKIYDDGTREKLRAAGAETGLRVISSKSFGNEIQLAKYLAGRQINEHRYRASSIKFCEVAEGRADLYPRFGPSREWDTAAGHAILLAAGGEVTTSTGQPLLYGKENFLNSDFVARGRR